MANLTPVIRLNDGPLLPIADLREVPLANLPSTPECDELVARIIDKHRNSARVDVMMFQSAI